MKNLPKNSFNIKISSNFNKAHPQTFYSKFPSANSQQQPVTRIKSFIYLKFAITRWFFIMQKFTSGKRRWFWAFFNIYLTLSLLTFNVDNDDKWSWEMNKKKMYIKICLCVGALEGWKIRRSGSTFHRYLRYYHYILKELSLP
jgi:hypothetical protein